MLFMKNEYFSVSYEKILHLRADFGRLTAFSDVSRRKKEKNKGLSRGRRRAAPVGDRIFHAKRRLPFPKAVLRIFRCGRAFFALSKTPLQIDHIHQLHAAFIDRVIVILGEKISDAVRTGKTAFFVKPDRLRRVSRSDL